MVHEVLSEFLQSVLPLPFNSTSMSVTSMYNGILKWFKDKAAIKFLRVNKHYGAKHLCKEFPTKNWSLRGLKTFEENVDETGFIE